MHHALRFSRKIDLLRAPNSTLQFPSPHDNLIFFHQWLTWLSILEFPAPVTFHQRCFIFRFVGEDKAGEFNLNFRMALAVSHAIMHSGSQVLLTYIERSLEFNSVWRVKLPTYGNVTEILLWFQIENNDSQIFACFRCQ